MDHVDPRWRKASYSGNGANCIEAGHAPGAILVRDTTDRRGVTLRVPAGAWAAFTGGLKGEGCRGKAA
jgi:Domain of unknown function (DUF397)